MNFVLLTASQAKLVSFLQMVPHFVLTESSLAFIFYLKTYISHRIICYLFFVLTENQEKGEYFMDIGYVRISAKTQNIARQLETMKNLGIDDRFIFQDVASEKNLIGLAIGL